MSQGREKLQGEMNWHSKRLRAKLLRFLKRIINRQERHKAHRNPECQPTYGKWSGYAD